MKNFCVRTTSGDRYWVRAAGARQARSLFFRSEGGACIHPFPACWRLLDREDGPAMECTSGFRYWFRRGKLHRRDGPAAENWDESARTWFRSGKRYEKREGKRRGHG